MFSLIQNAQNIGYLIPVEEIQLFLADIADGVYHGKPQVFDLVQTVENEALRRRLGLPKNVNGVMIAQPYSNDPNYPLQEWDVVTKIGDMPIDSDGKVAVRYDLRLSSSYLVQKYAKNGFLPLTIYRDGRTLEQSAANVEPTDADGVHERFFAAASTTLGETRARELDALIGTFESCANAAELARLTSKAKGTM